MIAELVTTVALAVVLPLEMLLRCVVTLVLLLISALLFGVPLLYLSDDGNLVPLFKVLLTPTLASRRISSDQGVQE